MKGLCCLTASPFVAGEPVVAVGGATEREQITLGGRACEVGDCPRLRRVRFQPIAISGAASTVIADEHFL